MNIYSHIIVARELEPILEPENSQEYYWGSIAPDIRYLANMRRSQTHIPIERIVDYCCRYPHLASFLHGYLVHCLSDELDLAQSFRRKFPFNFLKNSVPARHYPIILELFNMERGKQFRVSCSGTFNPVLSDLGITEEQATKFAQAVNQFLASPTINSAITLFQDLGLAGYERVEKYRIAARRFESLRFLKNLILLNLRIGKENKEVASSVKSAF